MNTDSNATQVDRYYRIKTVIYSLSSAQNDHVTVKSAMAERSTVAPAHKMRFKNEPQRVHISYAQPRPCYEIAHFCSKRSV